MKGTMLILHFIGLAMGLGTSFAHAFLSSTISKMDRSEADKFKHKIIGLNKMGHIGMLLLLISGIFLIITYWPAITLFPLLITKLILVFVLIILILLIGKGAQKNYRNNIEGNLKRINLMGKLALLTSVVIVILAVNVFN